MLCLISSIVWQILCAIMKPTNCVLCQSPLWSASKAFLNITHRLNNCSPRLYFFIYFFLLKPIPPLLTSRHFALAYWGYTNITPWSELSQWWQYCWSRPALKEFISSMSRFAEHLTNQSSSWCRNDFLDFSLAVVWLHIIRAGNKHTHRSVKNVGSWFQNRYLWPSWSSQKAYLCKSVSDPTHFRPPWPKSENVLLFDGSHISILSSSPWVMFTNDDRLGSIETSVCLDVSLLVPTRILRFLPPASLPLLNKSMAQLPQSSSFSLSLFRLEDFSSPGSGSSDESLWRALSWHRRLRGGRWDAIGAFGCLSCSPSSNSRSRPAAVKLSPPTCTSLPPLVAWTKSTCFTSHTFPFEFFLELDGFSKVFYIWFCFPHTSFCLVLPILTAKTSNWERPKSDIGAIPWPQISLPAVQSSC